MELPVQPSSQVSRGRNLERAPWCYLLWGAPVVIVIGRRSLWCFGTLAYGERSSLGDSCRMGWNRLFRERTILRQGPLQNRRNPLSTPQHHWRTKRAFDPFHSIGIY